MNTIFEPRYLAIEPNQTVSDIHPGATTREQIDIPQFVTIPFMEIFPVLLFRLNRSALLTIEAPIVRAEPEFWEAGRAGQWTTLDLPGQRAKIKVPPHWQGALSYVKNVVAVCGQIASGLIESSSELSKLEGLLFAVAETTANEAYSTKLKRLEPYVIRLLARRYRLPTHFEALARRTVESLIEDFVRDASAEYQKKVQNRLKLQEQVQRAVEGSVNTGPLDFSYGPLRPTSEMLDVAVNGMLSPEQPRSEIGAPLPGVSLRGSRGAPRKAITQKVHQIWVGLPSRTPEKLAFAMEGPTYTRASSKERKKLRQRYMAMVKRFEKQRATK